MTYGNCDNYGGYGNGWGGNTGYVTGYVNSGSGGYYPAYSKNYYYYNRNGNSNMPYKK